MATRYNITSEFLTLTDDSSVVSDDSSLTTDDSSLTNDEFVGCQIKHLEATESAHTSATVSHTCDRSSHAAIPGSFAFISAISDFSRNRRLVGYSSVTTDESVGCKNYIMQFKRGAYMCGTLWYTSNRSLHAVMANFRIIAVIISGILRNRRIRRLLVGYNRRVRRF